MGQMAAFAKNRSTLREACKALLHRFDLAEIVRQAVIAATFAGQDSKAARNKAGATFWAAEVNHRRQFVLLRRR